jgi:hypothetical protein
LIELLIGLQTSSGGTSMTDVSAAELRSAARTLKRVTNLLIDQRTHFGLSASALTAGDPKLLCELDDACQHIRRLAVELCVAYREMVIGTYLDFHGRQQLVRPQSRMTECTTLPVAFERKQAYKARVRNEGAVVEKLLQWSGGDAQTVFSSGENGALRANPWRTSLIVEACGPQYVIHEPEGEPKVQAISSYQQRKANNHGCEQILEGDLPDRSGH